MFNICFLEISNRIKMTVNMRIKQMCFQKQTIFFVCFPHCILWTNLELVHVFTLEINRQIALIIEDNAFNLHTSYTMRLSNNLIIWCSTHTSFSCSAYLNTKSFYLQQYTHIQTAACSMLYCKMSYYTILYLLCTCNQVPTICPIPLAIAVVVPGN